MKNNKNCFLFMLWISQTLLSENKCMCAHNASLTSQAIPQEKILKNDSLQAITKKLSRNNNLEDFLNNKTIQSLSIEKLHDFINNIIKKDTVNKNIKPLLEELNDLISSIKKIKENKWITDKHLATILATLFTLNDIIDHPFMNILFAYTVHPDLPRLLTTIKNNFNKSHKAIEDLSRDNNLKEFLKDKNIEELSPSELLGTLSYIAHTKKISNEDTHNQISCLLVLLNNITKILDTKNITAKEKAEILKNTLSFKDTLDYPELQRFFSASLNPDLPLLLTIINNAGITKAIDELYESNDIAIFLRNETIKSLSFEEFYELIDILNYMPCNEKLHKPLQSLLLLLKNIQIIKNETTIISEAKTKIFAIAFELQDLLNSAPVKNIFSKTAHYELFEEIKKMIEPANLLYKNNDIIAFLNHDIMKNLSRDELYEWIIIFYASTANTKLKIKLKYLSTVVANIKEIEEKDAITPKQIQNIEDSIIFLNHNIENFFYLEKINYDDSHLIKYGVTIYDNSPTHATLIKVIPIIEKLFLQSNNCSIRALFTELSMAVCNRHIFYWRRLKFL